MAARSTVLSIIGQRSSVSLSGIIIAPIVPSAGFRLGAIQHRMLRVVSYPSKRDPSIYVECCQSNCYNYAGIACFGAGTTTITGDFCPVRHIHLVTSIRYPIMALKTPELEKVSQP